MMSLNDNIKTPKTVSVSVSDRGFTYGDGVFETIAYTNGALDHWSLHWQRLILGSKRLEINLPDENYFLAEIDRKISQESDVTNQLATEQLTKNKVIKIIVTRGEGGRGYLFSSKHKSTVIVTVHSWPERSIDDYKKGIKAIVCQTCLAKQPALAGIKHLNRLEQVIARNEFSETDYEEGIMLSCSEHSSKLDRILIEGTSSNLFFVKNNQLYTPIIDTCGVQGTMRQAVINVAKQRGLVVKEDHFSLKVLKTASEIFFTNSIFGVVPVSSICINDEIQWNYALNRISGVDNFQSITGLLMMTINKNLNRPTF
ncbi:MAG: aminodeoxychorismate lyase [Gammaproteobacteria bacterium]|nr:aminodeoxychorismate lyase [Gammaproteobacteria bacterium]